MIEVTNIHKSFGDHHVLKGVSATFESGNAI
jgi:phospholipid/cholesterol/gamma-HCH transport system ATP-binding protein